MSTSVLLFVLVSGIGCSEASVDSAALFAVRR